jgi:apolipoprotein D and lipocalin family protein
VRQIAGEAVVVGPGRLEVKFDSVPFVSAPYWVLWVDEGYRTAVVGVPSGRAGWILNRDPQIPADRLEAARQILDFNGYDLTQLRMTPQPQR